jgi:membrane-associated phospholipid phosphatase
MFRIKVLLLGMILCFAISVPVEASDGIETAGEVLTFLLPATAAGLTVGFMDTEGMLQFGESAALSLGVSYGLKYTINEKRPNGGDHSFPSNHASISFASAEFMRKRYGWEYGIPAYVAATFVAYSRVEAKQHYTHDVIAAAAIGIGSSYLFTHPYKGWQVSLDVDYEYYGIILSRAW